VDLDRQLPDCITIDTFAQDYNQLLILSLSIPGESDDDALGSSSCIGMSDKFVHPESQQSTLDWKKMFHY
jgi:hypothetical protein